MKLTNHYKRTLHGVIVYYLIFDEYDYDYGKYMTINKNEYDKIVNNGYYWEERKIKL